MAASDAIPDVSAPPISSGWKRAPRRRYPPEVLTDDEVRRLITACGSRMPGDIRNAALIVVLYRTGLRITEALLLEPKDVELDAGTVRVLHAKGGRSRIVGI